MFLSLVVGLLIAGATAKPELTPQNNGNKILFYVYDDNSGGEIDLFDSQNYSIEMIAKFNQTYLPFQVATTQNKVFAISNFKKTSFEIFDLNTRQVSKGPNPPEWRKWASVAYFKDKLYYLGGLDPETYEDMNRVDVLIDGQWQTGPALPSPPFGAQAVTSNGVLYDDEREWLEIGEIPEQRGYFGVASLNGKIYITGGQASIYSNLKVYKSCLCFDPSAPVGSRISQIADMSNPREHHLLFAANGKLYLPGSSIEEYDPQTNKWRKVGEIKIK